MVSGFAANMLIDERAVEVLWCVFADIRDAERANESFLL
jgi:hypothetical protein